VSRVCFIAHVKPDRLAEYRRRHEQVWPEMLEALRRAGWGNYSLFLAPDGLLVGYLETDDFDAAQAAMAGSEVNARWQAEMADFFVGAGDRRPDEGFVVLDETFNLEDQLRRAALQ
jgi:L-rhamnose mutarotase